MGLKINKLAKVTGTFTGVALTALPHDVIMAKSN